MDTDEMYLQGMSSSLPYDVQLAMYRTIRGFEKIEIMRPAYAIEYDCCDPTGLAPTLEFKAIPGLYGAGQFNGTSGYEEAAAQGLVAGVNAARKVQGKEQIVLSRGSSYIGTLIDDLVSKGCMDPYRMLTARSEYRLLLRQDNADERLTPLGHEIGLISEERYKRFLDEMERKNSEIIRLEKELISPLESLNRLIVSRETMPVAHPVKLADLLRRPQISYADLELFDPNRPPMTPRLRERIEIAVKYEGYIKKQLEQVARAKRLEKKALPFELDYAAVSGLRLEAKEKLAKIRPLNIAQASRISGVTPADISVLLIWCAAHDGKARKEDHE